MKRVKKKMKILQVVQVFAMIKLLFSPVTEDGNSHLHELTNTYVPSTDTKTDNSRVICFQNSQGIKKDYFRAIQELVNKV